MQQEVSELRAAIRAGDPEKTEAAWEKVEQWLDLTMLGLLKQTE
jgi:hypothetical protein